MRITGTSILIAFLLTAGFLSVAGAHQLLVNGDFEQDLGTGWSIDSIEGMTPYYDTLDRGIDFNPDPDYEVRVKKYDSAHAMLYQIFDVDSTDLAFGITAKLYAVEYNPSGSYFAAAAVVLSYQNDSGVVLGETRICYKTAHCTWASSGTLHLIEAPDSNWNTYSFNVNDELANLPGVNPLDIAKVKIALFDTTNGCWGAHCLARVLADNASVFALSGVNEDDADRSGKSMVMNAMPTIVSRSSPLEFTTGRTIATGSMKIFNIRGQLVKNLKPADHGTRVAWLLDDESGEDVPEGVYFIRYENGMARETRKLIVVK